MPTSPLFWVAIAGVCLALFRAIRKQLSHVNLALFDNLALRLCRERRLDRLAKICDSVIEAPHPRAVSAALTAVEARDPDDAGRLLDVAIDAYRHQHGVRVVLAGNAWPDVAAVLMASLPAGAALGDAGLPTAWMWAMGVVALLAAMNTARLRRASLARDAATATPLLEAIVDAKLNPTKQVESKSDGIYRTASVVVEEPALPPRSIRVARDGAEVSRYPLPEDGIMKIGRLASSHIALDDPTVSRMHAVLELTPDSIEIIDLGSDSGILVNGARTHKKTLVGGDRLTIGAFELELSPQFVSETPVSSSSEPPAAPEWSCKHCGGTTSTPVTLPSDLAQTLAARSCNDCNDVSWTTRKPD